MSYAMTIVLVRLFAAYVVLEAINQFLQLFPFVVLPFEETGYQDAAMYGQLAAVIAIAAAGVLVWIFSRGVAKHVIGVSHTERPSLEGEQVVAAGTFLIGLYWLVRGLWDALGLLLTCLGMVGTGDGYSGLLSARTVSGPVVSIMLGVLLMLGTNRIVRLFHALRRAGH